MTADAPVTCNPRPLSKSKLIAFRQCPKRLWLEIHRPEAREDSSTTQAVFRTGHEVGALAQRLYDPAGEGAVIDWQAEGMACALEHTRLLLQQPKPIFEAGFAGAGGLAFADVMLPVTAGQEPAWKMVEVKSSTSVKRYHEDDIAIQSHIARAAGVNLRSVCIAHIDATWVYPGQGDYSGLLIEKDMTAAALARSAEVATWIASAQQVTAQAQPPRIPMGGQCVSPFPCGFQTHCGKELAEVEFPVTWLPRTPSKAFKDFLAESHARDMREVPNALLTPMQRRVRDASLSGQPYFDAEGARQDLAPYPLPAYFLDFETIQFGVPRWAGTRPFQMLPFQFSLHRLDARGELTHCAFLDLSGSDPSQAFSAALAQACAEPLPIFVYNAGFEGARLKELVQRFPLMAQALLAIHGRLVDLLPITRTRYYHPLQRGSWSIKQVLPTLAPNARHDALPGVRDGSMAMEAYVEAISPATTAQRKAAIHGELLAYCALDTLAMVEVWRNLSQGQHPPYPSITPSPSPTKEYTMSTQAEPTPQAPFFAQLMQHLMDGTMIPKVQVERSIGPIIGFFLADALSTPLGEDIVMLCPEFPIRNNRPLAMPAAARIVASEMQKQESNQSTNIDWLMLNRRTQELLLVELKTTDTSFRTSQAEIYQTLQSKIGHQQSAAFLADDLEDICDASQERGKYLNVQKMLAAGLGVAEDKIREALARCKSAKVIYLAPEASKPRQWREDWTWLSFSDLPLTLKNHAHADQWPTLRSSLIGLDTFTRRMRNGDDAAEAGGKNYKELLEYAEALDCCRSKGASIVLGFVNWRSELPAASLEDLKTRSFKCDEAEGGTGKKVARNWISGDQFLAQVTSKMEAAEQTEDSLPLPSPLTALLEHSQIPRSELLVNHWYAGKGRNADIGLWNGEDFLVLTQIGVKMGPGRRDWDKHWGVKVEPYFEAESGCFQPFKLVEMGTIATALHDEREYAKTMLFKD